jgi:hypothetical protein
METSNVLRPLGSNGIWPLRWLDLRNNSRKLVKFCSPGDIDPLMLLLDRLRAAKLVKCPITCGIIPVILLSLKLRRYNLLEEHCGNFSMNSVMFPDDRLPSSNRVSNSHRFFKSTAIVAEFPFSRNPRIERDVIRPSASGKGP